MRIAFLSICFLILQPVHSQLRKICELQGMPEISGSFILNDQWWALNDGGNASVIYRLDTSSGKPSDSTTFVNVFNIDWEELADNGNQVFIGDFGNNNGTRKDLRVFRFPAHSLGLDSVKCDTINFFYPAQSNFNSNPLTIYDCEAMIALQDSLILFSKSISDAVCRVYSIPNIPGNHPARLIDTLQLNFWITGACIQNENLALIGYGYNGQLTPQMWYGTWTNNRINRNQVQLLKFNYNGPLQIESCMFGTIPKFYLTAENSNGFIASLMEYRLPEKPLRSESQIKSIGLYPNPAKGRLYLQSGPEWQGARVYIYDTTGKLMKEDKLRSSNTGINISALAPGHYNCMVKLEGKTFSAVFVIP